MTHKSRKIAEWTEGLRCGSLDPRYVGFFRLFNRQQYFEAHEVLEDLWLENRQSPDYHFHKGLIQLAGAFVHFQKGRAQPATALLRLAANNLARYPDAHHQLRVAELRRLISLWLDRAQQLRAGQNALSLWAVPEIQLESSAPG